MRHADTTVDSVCMFPLTEDDGTGATVAAGTALFDICNAQFLAQHIKKCSSRCYIVQRMPLASVNQIKFGNSHEFSQAVNCLLLLYLMNGKGY